MAVTCVNTTSAMRTGWRSNPRVMQDRRAEAEMIFRRVGITFAVYGAKDESGGQRAAHPV